MNNLLVILFVGAAYLCGQFPALAQSPDSILKRAGKSMGGEKLLRGIASKRILGKISRLRDGASGKFSLQTSQTSFFAQSFDVDGFETALGFNGKSGWQRDSQNGLRTLTGEASKTLQALANYRNNFWFNYKKDKSKIVLSGQTVIDGSQTDIISLTTSKGVLIKIYINKKSGLPLRDEIPQMSLTNTYSDYRNVDGIQEPFLIVSNVGEETYEIRLDSATHNEKIAKTAFDFPNFSNEPLPDIPNLLKEVRANEERIDNILENYTFTQTNTMREISKDGILRDKESETFQLTFYKGYRIRRLIEKNGKPLSLDEQAKEDKKTQEQIKDIEKEVAKNQAKTLKQTTSGTPSENSQRPSIADVLRASNLINPRREMFRGRDVIVFDFEPNPNFDYKNSKSFLKLFGKTAGVMWIDVQDKQVARLEAVLADNYKVGGGLVANLKKGASFILENDRVNNEVWLPSSADINLSVKIFLVKGISVNQSVKYNNYQKFNSEVKDSKVDEVKQP